MEEERKWEDLNKDLLVEIFGRVGLESLSQCIPFVCNSWYKATLVPKCWETLVFHACYYESGLGSEEFVKYAVDRSQGTATHVEFHNCCPDGLVYLSEKCSELKSLYLRDFYSCELICDLICKWEKLEFLHMSRTKLPRDCLVQILKGCRELEFLDVSDCYGFDAHDTEILELASHIRSFNCDGSFVNDSNEDDYPLYDDDDDDPLSEYSLDDPW